jgi:predicted DsbA family dithiol-disulfide isomerase
MPTWGGGDATPVNVAVFCSVTDFLCRRLDDVFVEIAGAYGSKVQFQWIDTPPADVPAAWLAAEALEEAYLQKETPAFLDLKARLSESFKRKQPISQPMIEFQARQVGLDLPKVHQSLLGHTNLERVKKGQEGAAAANISPPAMDITGTPPSAVNDIEGYYVRGAPPMRVLRRLIDKSAEERAASK